MNQIQSIEFGWLSSGSVRVLDASHYNVSHLIPQLLTPFNHLRYCLLVHALPRFSKGIDDGEVGLKSVERSNRILQYV